MADGERAASIIPVDAGPSSYMAESDKSSPVKFVDRRRLSDDGELRTDLPPEPPAPPVAPAPVPTASASESEVTYEFPGTDAAGTPAAAPDAPAQENPEAEAAGPVKFEQVIQSLVAPVQMILSGQAGQVSPEEAVAHLNFTIEAIELLERKTRGHLTTTEAAFLKTVGGSLKMIYMQMLAPPAPPGQGKVANPLKGKGRA